jgi:hypothetical protein
MYATAFERRNSSSMSDEPTRITKAEAARRQLDCAIRLRFADEDQPIHTLVAASFRVLYDVCEHSSQSDVFAVVKAHVAARGWQMLNAYANFLKHADKDASAVIDELDPRQNDHRIGFAVLLYKSLGNRPMPEMKAFETWMAVLNPDLVELEFDEDPESVASYRQSIEQLRQAKPGGQLALGRVLMEVYRQGILPIDQGLRRRSSTG